MELRRSLYILWNFKLKCIFTHVAGSYNLRCYCSFNYRIILYYMFYVAVTFSIYLIIVNECVMFMYGPVIGLFIYALIIDMHMAGGAKRLNGCRDLWTNNSFPGLLNEGEWVT